jgi:hypothetical protein
MRAFLSFDVAGEAAPRQTGFRKTGRLFSEDPQRRQRAVLESPGRQSSVRLSTADVFTRVGGLPDDALGSHAIGGVIATLLDSRRL